MSDISKGMEEIAEWQRTLVGLTLHPRWPHFNTEATRDNIRRFCIGIGDYNPLYRDEEYARRTHYGQLVAPPNFLESVMHTGAGNTTLGNMATVPDTIGMDGGTDWEWYKPLLVGDRFTYAQKLLDIAEKQTRSFGRAFVTHAETIIWNQHNEVVAKARGRVFWAEKPIGGAKPRPVHRYSGEELRAIGNAYRSESIRGGTPRFWEDVQVGEELNPIVRGPLDHEDLVAFLVGAGAEGIRAHRRLAYPGGTPDLHHSKGKQVFQEPVNTADWMMDSFGGGRPQGMMRHVDESVSEEQGVGVPYDFAQQRMSWFITLFTNWQGDTGFLKQLSAQLKGVNQLGDTTWFKGRVVKKEVLSGEHLVHIECWGENQLGSITTPGSATVVLPSREATTAR